MANVKIETVTVEKRVWEDQLRYVLTLDPAEASLLGALRHFYVKGDSELYSILHTLPHDPTRAGIDRSLDIVSRDSDFIRVSRKLEESQKEVARLSEALANVAIISPAPSGSWHASAEQEVTPTSEGWKVQYYNYGMRGWEHIDATARTFSRSPGKIAPFTSRNAAYRNLRARAMWANNPQTAYRVVPYEYPDGHDTSPRGKFKAQIWAVKSRRWVDSHYVSGLYDTTIQARDAINKWGQRNSTYRVKWVP